MQIDRNTQMSTDKGQALRQSLSRAKSRDSGQALRLGQLRWPRSGQGTIDITLVVVAMCAILFAGLKMFVWFNRSLAERQEAYEAGQTYSPPPIHLIQGEE